MQIVASFLAPVQPVAPARRIVGTYARPTDPCAVQPVRLADGRKGFRVGPQGRIYANHADAVRFAQAREGRLARIGGGR